MPFLFIAYSFSDFTTAIGWTLIHSLWQGLLVTVLAGSIIMVTRRSKASLRYLLLSGLFFVFLLGACTTFIIELQQGAIKDIEQVVSGDKQIAFFGAPGNPVSRETTESLASRFVTYFNTHSFLIVGIWFFIFMIKCLRLVADISYAQRLRQNNCSAITDWEEKIRELSKRLSINRMVLLRESSVIKVPVVIGFLKPVILLPLGLVSNLPPGQVEAILLHELAHIRRKDYLINLLQCFGETIFFFNPAVWWLSAQIRQERENCCDDIAIGITGNKTTFIHALVAFHEYRLHTPVLATAFPGEKYPVLQRIKRIAYNNNKNLNNMEKIFLAAGFMLTVSLAVGFSSQDTTRLPAKRTSVVADPGSRETRHETVIIADTVPDNKEKKDITGTITTLWEGKEYTIVMKNNVIKGLFIDSERIADEKIGGYKDITTRIINETMEKATLARADARKNKELAELSKLSANEAALRQKKAMLNLLEAKLGTERKLKASELEFLKEKLIEIAEKEEKPDQLKSKSRKNNAELADDQYRELLKLRKKESGMEEEQYQKLLELKLDQSALNLKTREDHMAYEKEVRLLNKQEMQYKEVHDKLMKQDSKHKADKEYKIQADEMKLMKDKMKTQADESKKQAVVAKMKGDQLRQNIIDDLAADNIIQDKKHVSFQLNNEEMIVNGVKQPEKVFRKFKEKYGKSPETKIGFTYSDN